jgi:hypothetical protein
MRVKDFLGFFPEFGPLPSERTDVSSSLESQKVFLLFFYDGYGDSIEERVIVLEGNV